MKHNIDYYQPAFFLERAYVIKKVLLVGEKCVFVEIIFFSAAGMEFLNLLFQQSNENNPFSFLDIQCLLYGTGAVQNTYQRKHK